MPAEEVIIGFGLIILLILGAWKAIEVGIRIIRYAVRVARGVNVLTAEDVKKKLKKKSG